MPKFADLGRLCREITGAHDRLDYRARFSWVDNIRPVESAEHLEERVIGALRQGIPDNFVLAVPEMIEWEQIKGFQFDFDRHGPGTRRRDARTRRPDPELAEYLRGLGTAQANLTVDQLHKDRLFAVDADGGVKHDWSIWNCLSGEFDVDGEPYVLDEGRIYEIASTYKDELQSDLSHMEEWSEFLPDARSVKEHEDDYNVRAADSPDRLMLHKKLVRPGRGTTAIEVCDVLCEDGTFIHVKKGWSSSQLSHLFEQGATSAELLRRDSEFKDGTLRRIKEAEEERAEASSDGGFVGRFQPRVDCKDPPTGRRHVVFAIVERWKGRSLVEAMPFFGKVNLRAAEERLRDLGFTASYKRVAIPTSTPTKRPTRK